MAKLNVVIPAVDVEVIGEGGVKTKYRKVDRAAKKGDIIKITENNGEDYVVEGAFYEVKYVDFFGDPQIDDEDGDEMDTAGMEYEVYENVAEEAAPKCREVKRWAKVGERIKIVNATITNGTYKNGDVFTVIAVNEVGGVDIDKKGRDIVGYMCLYEYVVLEPIEETAKPKRLTVGDYAKVVHDNYEHKTGHIVRIIEDYVGGPTFDYKVARVTIGGTGYIAAKNIVRATESEVAAAKQDINPRNKFAKGDKVRIVSGAGERYLYGYENGDIVEVMFGPDSGGDYGLSAPRAGVQRGNAQADQLEKVSAEEVAEIERQQSEESKWAAIGRKVNEFKRGDFVEATRRFGCSERVLGKVVDGPQVQSDGELALGIMTAERHYYSVNVEGAKLIVPAEQRFDSAA